MVLSNQKKKKKKKEKKKKREEESSTRYKDTGPCYYVLFRLTKFGDEITNLLLAGTCTKYLSGPISELIKYVK